MLTDLNLISELLVVIFDYYFFRNRMEKTNVCKGLRIGKNVSICYTMMDNTVVV